ncbi:MAG TPA: L,D-transpeptidase family protein [Bacteroidales bacterium]|nr:L,D-transpeptidase family protein [Bacteroidales bacterium]
MKKAILLISALLFITFSTLAALHLLSAKPPVGLLEQCHRDIAVARDSEASEYEAGLLIEAEKLYELAQEELKKENEKLFFLRDYNAVIQTAKRASEKAAEAVTKTNNRKNELSISQKEKIEEVRDKLEHFEKNYASLPLNKKARQDYTTAKLKFLESEKAFERQAYLVVENNLNEAKRLISKSVTAAHNHLSDYFSSLPSWKRWVDETINWSRVNNEAAIIVDKFAHKCYVYNSGKLVREFDAELGPNWIGDKNYKGDKATPEGKYHVTKLKSGKNTVYYKALLINYPNDEDKARYKQNVKSGRIPNRGPGNLIEIHGGGGKGINWTDGCVALTNDDMDKLWKYVSVGTPVTIVGSVRSLQEINGH